MIYNFTSFVNFRFKNYNFKINRIVLIVKSIFDSYIGVNILQSKSL